MEQIIWNYISIFGIPLLAGVLVRLAFFKFRKGFIITLIGAILTLVHFIIMLNPPVNGNEGYALMTLAMLCATVGAAVVGVVIRWRNK